MMTIADVFETSRHRSNLAYFTAIVNLANIDGEINKKEEKSLIRFAKKLDIAYDEYKHILKDPEKYPLISVNSFEERLNHIYELFRLIYADHKIDDSEYKLMVKYAIGLGVPLQQAEAVIDRSIEIFEGKINFEDYFHLMEKNNI